MYWLNEMFQIIGFGQEMSILTTLTLKMSFSLKNKSFYGSNECMLVSEYECVCVSECVSERNRP